LFGQIIIGVAFCIKDCSENPFKRFFIAKKIGAESLTLAVMPK